MSWAHSATTARHAVIYDDTPATAAIKHQIAYVTLDADVPANPGTFTITWDAVGILTATAA